MKKKLHFLGNRCALFLLASFLSGNSFGQTGTVDAGITIGPCNLLGDLGGNMGKGSPFIKDNNISQTKLLIGAHITLNMNDWLSFRLGVNAGSLSGNDAIIKSRGGLEEARKIRNQNFKSPVVELLAIAEFYPTVFLEQTPEYLFHKVRPYGLIGLGAFHFNPKGKDPVSGNWVNLRDLHTEGEGFAEYPDRKEYSLYQINVPVGAGLKYYVNDRTSLSLDIIYRFTFTDYLDDVSTNYIDPDLFYQHLPLQQAMLAQRMADKRNGGSFPVNGGDKRGTPGNNDGYYSVSVKLNFRLGGGNQNLRNSTRCPVIRF